jgi:AcrR family transcriptional regulator
MKSKKTTRGYDMTARAEKAAQTERSILQATAALWQELSIHEIALEAVAERAGVSVRTILRKYGSKEGLFEVCIETDAAENERRRNEAPAGDIEAALRILLDDYEQYGDANIRTLAVEAELEVARKLLDAGRKYHRRLFMETPASRPETQPGRDFRDFPDPGRRPDLLASQQSKPIAP